MEHILNRCEGVRDQNNQSLNHSLESYLRNHAKDFELEQAEDAKVRSLQQNGLTLLDGWHIQPYTATASGWLNDSAREGKPSKCPCVEVFAEGLKSCLRKLPAYQGTAYRMERCDEEGIKSGWFADHVGSSFRLPYFLSTARFDYNNSPMVWIIQTCAGGKGRYIGDMANGPGEQEVLFRMNSYFEIIRVDGNNPDKVLVYLQELPDATEEMFDLTSLYYRNL
jgi:hypothetical protein